MGNFRAMIAKKTDRRVRLLEEMIVSMRLVKMYVWEGFFLSKLIDYRKAEMWKQRVKLSVFALCDSILRSSRSGSSSFGKRFLCLSDFKYNINPNSKYLLAVILSIYFSGSSLSDFKTSDLFAVSMFIKIIEENLRFMSMTATLFNELINACKRIQEVLELPENCGTENPVFEKSTKIEKLTARYLGFKLSIIF